jgi:hypothetical protein
VDRVDVNGDGRQDLVLWRLVGDLEPRTDVLVFLRDVNGRLPEQPTQVLHCRGFPLWVGDNPKAGPARRRVSPVCDLAGDGKCELVLLTLKTTLLSVSGVLDLFLSGSVNWGLTIRTFTHGAFSGSPEATIPLTTMVPVDQATPEEVFHVLIEGDFNGDGRPDILVKRSSTQWDIVFSSADGWFAPKPSLSFEVPVEGHLDIRDLNGDGVSDLVVQPWDEPKLCIFLSQTHSRMRQNQQVSKVNE